MDVLAEEFLDYQITFSLPLTLMAAALQRLVHIVAQFEVIEMPPLLGTDPLRLDQQLHIPYLFHKGSRPLKKIKSKKVLLGEDYLSLKPKLAEMPKEKRLPFV